MKLATFAGRNKSLRPQPRVSPCPRFTPFVYEPCVGYLTSRSINSIEGLWDGAFLSLTTWKSYHMEMTRIFFLNYYTFNGANWSVFFALFSWQAKDLCLRVFARYPEFSSCSDLSSFEVLSNPKYCGKMKVLDKLLRMFRQQHCKVLLFSRSTQVCF